MQVSSVSGRPPARRRGRGGCLIGCLVALAVAVPLFLVAVFVLPAVGVSQLGWRGPVGRLLNAEPIMKSEFGIELRDLAGADPKRYEPWTHYPQIAGFAGADARLVKVRLAGVRSDGTLDLTATYTPAPRADYTFQRKLAGPPPHAPPIGAGGSATGEWFEPIAIEVYRPGQRRTITRTSGGGSTSIQYTNRGMQREAKAAVARGEATIAAPTCALADLWREAIARGAPASAVATIEYTAEGYRFSIAGARHDFAFGTDCRIKAR